MKIHREEQDRAAARVAGSPQSLVSREGYESSRRVIMKVAAKGCGEAMQATQNLLHDLRAVRHGVQSYETQDRALVSGIIQEVLDAHAALERAMQRAAALPRFEDLGPGRHPEDSR